MVSSSVEAVALAWNLELLHTCTELPVDVVFWSLMIPRHAGSGSRTIACRIGPAAALICPGGDTSGSSPHSGPQERNMQALQLVKCGDSTRKSRPRTPDTLWPHVSLPVCLTDVAHVYHKAPSPSFVAPPSKAKIPLSSSSATRGGGVYAPGSTVDPGGVLAGVVARLPAPHFATRLMSAGPFDICRTSRLAVAEGTAWRSFRLDKLTCLKWTKHQKR